MANRYENITNIIKEYKPKTICEIGTYNGRRAISILLAALKYKNNIKYFGYDLFEEASSETDESELNGKTTRTEMDLISDRIKTKVTSKVKGKKNQDFHVELFKGNTNDVLKSKKYDFAYIDGGHHIDTIRNDYSKLKSSKVIIFDDYYDSHDEEKLASRISEFGCNLLIKELRNDENLTVSIMPLYDEGDDFITRQILVVRK